VWVSGSGAYYVRIFAYSKGKVAQVLEAGSKLMPEFVYPTLSFGNYSQRIIFANGSWLVDEKSGQTSFHPSSADVYTWNGESYEARKNVAWKERLN
jgi:hypothetical protein